MPSARRFPPPWTIEQHNEACFIVKDATAQALGYFYFEDAPGRRSAATLGPTAARMWFKSWPLRRPATFNSYRRLVREEVPDRTRNSGL
jgi:hypothetical protein